MFHPRCEANIPNKCQAPGETAHDQCWSTVINDREYTACVDDIIEYKVRPGCSQQFLASAYFLPSPSFGTSTLHYRLHPASLLSRTKQSEVKYQDGGMEGFSIIHYKVVSAQRVLKVMAWKNVPQYARGILSSSCRVLVVLLGKTKWVSFATS